MLKFDVSAETLATVRDALAKLRRDAGCSLDDDAALLLMARQVLGGPGDEGRSSYQVYLNVCERCSSGQQLGHGELVEVASEVVQMASCDAQHVRAHGGATGLVFRHADGTPYGQRPKPQAADVRGKAFSALRSMGYRESEARLGIERACAPRG